MTGRLPKGHPATLHPWWARRPLPACRAVIFASMVDDPGDCADDFPTEAEQQAERERLHGIIEQLVVWKIGDDERLIAGARWEIARSVARARGEDAPDRDDPTAVLRYLESSALPLYDPFCGRGSIPIEAQRLGLRTTGADLNPVAVLITKALIELPQEFRHRAPVNPDSDPMGMTIGRGRVAWRGSAGLSDDIRWYGQWMRGRGGSTYWRPVPERKAVQRRGGDCHCLAVGEDGPMSESRMPRCNAFAQHLPSVLEDGRPALDTACHRYFGKDRYVCRSGY